MGGEERKEKCNASLLVVASILLSFVLVILLTAASQRSCAPSSELLAPSDATASAWRFVRYERSQWEEEWVAGISGLHARECETLASRKHLARARAWLSLSDASQNLTFDAAAASAAYDRTLPAGHGAAMPTLLRVAVEPLAGVLRDPRSVCDGTPLYDPQSSIQSKDFLYLAPELFALARELRGAHGRVVIFDVGATTFSDTRMPGLSWLYARLVAQGLPPTDVYSWEAKPQKSGDAFFNGMPQALLNAAHFFNFRAEAGAGIRDPLEILRSLARDDFVIFKLDIDNTPTEEAIVKKLLADTELLARVDVFFWEHHVDIVEMRRYWGSHGGMLRSRLNATYDYLSRLRTAGVSAHSWP